MILQDRNEDPCFVPLRLEQLPFRLQVATTIIYIFFSLVVWYFVHHESLLDHHLASSEGTSSLTVLAHGLRSCVDLADRDDG